MSGRACRTPRCARAAECPPDARPPENDFKGSLRTPLSGGPGSRPIVRWTEDKIARRWTTLTVQKLQRARSHRHTQNSRKEARCRPFPSPAGKAAGGAKWQPATRPTQPRGRGRWPAPALSVGRPAGCRPGLSRLLYDGARKGAARWRREHWQRFNAVQGHVRRWPRHSDMVHPVARVGGTGSRNRPSAPRDLNH